MVTVVLTAFSIASQLASELDSYAMRAHGFALSVVTLRDLSPSIALKRDFSTVYLTVSPARPDKNTISYRCFGTMAMTQAVLPQFRLRKTGVIVNVHLCCAVEIPSAAVGIHRE